MQWDSASSVGPAQSYCSNLVIGNYGAGSWRLPTVKELTTLVDYQEHNPAISTNIFSVGTPLGIFWASALTKGSLQRWVWWVSLGDGRVSYDTPSHFFEVRCILNTSASANNGKWSPLAYQDATNQAARYYISGTSPNAIVTDDFTGLMWEQQVSPSTYIWNASATTGSAQAYCANLTKGGYTDWRLPTVLELRSIVDYTLGSPSINAAVFPNTPNAAFWTSMIYAVNAAQAWYISSSGGVHPTTFSPFKVRCVRGIQSKNPNRFTDENGLTLTGFSTQVRDALTGLIWKRTPAASQMIWSSESVAGSVQNYCKNLVVENFGVGSWRLPTIKELATLIDYSTSYPTINRTAFPGIASSSLCWSSSPGNTSSPWYQFSGLGDGINVASSNTPGEAFCTRNNDITPNNGMWSPLAYEDTTNQTARYYISGSAPNAIVTDDFTGLMWEQQVSSSTYFWNESAPTGSAQAYCAGLTKGGYKDWRLPTPQELQSLVDYTLTSSFPINTLAFFGPAARY